VQLDPQVAAFARAHNGLVSIEAWAAAGLSRRSFHRAVEAGWVVRVGPGVVALAGTAVGPTQRIHAAVLASRPPVVASHRSAAFLWGAPVAGAAPVDLPTTAGRNASRRTGVVVHRPNDREGLVAARRAGIPVTAPPRTLLDLGAVRPASVASALDAFLVAGLVSVPTLRRALAAHRRPGRNGVRALDAALSAVALDARPPDSVLELRVAALFRRHGIVGWTFHARVASFEVDFAFVRERVVVEVDGYAHHRGRVAFGGDRRRDATLASLGWVVLRFTWYQVTRRGGEVARITRATLDGRPRG
jgi:very-short-patch-repair endonuclease